MEGEEPGPLPASPGTSGGTGFLLCKVGVVMVQPQGSGTRLSELMQVKCSEHHRNIINTLWI